MKIVIPGACNTILSAALLPPLRPLTYPEFVWSEFDQTDTRMIMPIPCPYEFGLATPTKSS